MYILLPKPVAEALECVLGDDQLHPGKPCTAREQTDAPRRLQTGLQLVL